MTPQRHRIRRQVFEVAVSSREAAWPLQSELSRIQAQKLEAILDACLSEVTDASQIYRIDKLEVDLGNLDPENLEHDLVEKLGPALRDALGRRRREDLELSRQTGEDPQARSNIELLAYFVQTGTVPWWADGKKPRIVEESVDQLIRRAPKLLIELLRTFVRERGRLLRIVMHCDDARLATVMRLLLEASRPDVKASAATSIAAIASLAQTRGIVAEVAPAQWRSAVWLGALRAASIQQTGGGLTKFWQDALAEIGIEAGTTYVGLVETVEARCRIEGGIAISDEVKENIRELHQKTRQEGAKGKAKGRAIDGRILEEVRGFLERELSNGEANAQQPERLKHLSSRTSDVRPSDVRPSDVRHPDVRPSDVRPSDIPPSDIPPSDIRPSDVAFERSTDHLPAGGEAAEQSEAVGWALLNNTPTSPAASQLPLHQQRGVLEFRETTKANASSHRAASPAAIDQFSRDSVPPDFARTDSSSLDSSPSDLLSSNSHSFDSQSIVPASINSPSKNVLDSALPVPTDLPASTDSSTTIDTPLAKTHDLTQLTQLTRLSHLSHLSTQSQATFTSSELAAAHSEVDRLLTELQRISGPLTIVFVELHAQISRARPELVMMLLSPLRFLLRQFTSENLASEVPELSAGVQLALRQIVDAGFLQAPVLRRCISSLQTAVTVETSREELALERQRLRRRAMLERSLSGLVKKLPIDLRHSESEAAYVENAGLILLWPFLVSLFSRLELVVEKQFVSREARYRAAGLLQHLTTGELEPQEHQLILFKLLCGLEPTELYYFGEPVTAAEAAECSDLLSAAITHAEILGELTITELREAFLIRKGVLSARDGVWLLRVERMPQDKPLGKLPWALSWVKLPWLETPLQIEW